jgi:hypothetical protein
MCLKFQQQQIKMHISYAPTLLKNSFQSSFENLMFGKVSKKKIACMFHGV